MTKISYLQDQILHLWVRGLFIYHILRAPNYLKGPGNQAVASLFANKGNIDRNECLEPFLVKRDMTSTYCSHNNLPS